MALDEETKRQILANIENYGSAETRFQVKIANLTQGANLVDNSSGRPRFSTYNAKKFDLILAQPLELVRAFNPFQIRCCLCNKVISYPAWYRVIRYTGNHFHHFVCFDSTSPSKVSAKCIW